MNTKPQLPDNEACDPFAAFRGVLASVLLGTIAWGLSWGAFAWLLNQ